MIQQIRNDKNDPYICHVLLMESVAGPSWYWYGCVMHISCLHLVVCTAAGSRGWFHILWLIWGGMAERTACMWYVRSKSIRRWWWYADLYTGICHIIIIHIILTCWQAATSSISREQQPLSMIEHHEWRNWRDGWYSCLLQFQILTLVWLDAMSRLGFILATVLVLTVSSKFSTAFLPPRPTASLFLSSTCLASGLGDKHGNVDPSKDHPNGNNTTTWDFKISPGNMVSVKRKKGSKFKKEVASRQ